MFIRDSMPFQPVARVERSETRVMTPTSPGFRKLHPGYHSTPNIQGHLDTIIGLASKTFGLEPKLIGQTDAGKQQVSGKIDVAVTKSLSKKNTVDDIVVNYGRVIIDGPI